MTRTSIDLGDVTHHNIKQLKKLNTFVFPVSYNDKFYIDVLEAGELAKLAYYNDIVVGAVCCRIYTTENQRRLYIMTLGCLHPYRRLGIGSVMVNHILNYVEKDGNFDSIFLHVQINNDGAIEFYKKFGFEIVETKENYYKRIEPADAFVLQRNLKNNNNNHIMNNNSQTSSLSSSSSSATGTTLTTTLMSNVITTAESLAATNATTIIPSSVACNPNNNNNNNNNNDHCDSYDINNHTHINGIDINDTLQQNISNTNSNNHHHHNHHQHHHHNHHHQHSSHGKSKA